MDKSPYSIIEVVWVDSEAEQDWKPLAEVLEGPKSLECRTVGYLLMETEDRLVLAGSVSIDKQIHGHMTIPKVAIKERKDWVTHKKVPRVKKEKAPITEPLVEPAKVVNE